MEININSVRKMLAEKEKNISTAEDKEKIDVLKVILNDDTAFLKLNMQTAVGILEFLGVPKKEITNYYFELISPKNNQFNEYVTVSKEM